MAFLRQKNPQGYVFGELYSALQKSLRRGLEENAVYWARQIGNTNPNALHKRLLLCALEDMPYPQIINRIMTIPPSVLGLSEMLRMVITLCRVPKTHITAWANRVAGEILLHQHNPAGPTAYHPFDQRPELLQIAAYLLENDDGRRNLVRAFNDDALTRLYRTANEDPLVFIMRTLLDHRVYSPPPVVYYTDALPADNSKELREMPEWVFDKHTARGKAAGRGYAHFFAEGLVFNHLLFADATEDPYEQEARRLYLDYERRLGSKARTRTGQLIAKIRKPEPAKQGEGKRKANDDDDDDASTGVDQQQQQQQQPHQQIAAVKRRPTGHTQPHQREKASNAGDVLALLASKYADLLQTQLITSSYKPRVFFATSLNEPSAPDDSVPVPVAVKGPVTREFANQQLQSEKVKQILGLPHGHMHTDEIGGKLFLVSRSFVKYDPNAYELRSSTLETDAKISTNVVEPWDHQLVVRHPQHPLVLKLMMALAFRKAIGTNDTTPRNFILFTNRVTGEKDLATIDDPALMQDTEFMWKTQIKPDEYIRALNLNWAALRSELQKWISLIQHSDLPALFKEFVLRRLAMLNNAQSNWTFKR